MRHAAWLLALCQLAVWVVVGVALSVIWPPLPGGAPSSPASRPGALLPVPPLSLAERPVEASPGPAAPAGQVRGAGIVEVEAYRSDEGATAIRRGCGVLVTRQGHVFIPLPVIQGADALVLTFSSGLRSPARRLAEDRRNQLALIKALVLPPHPSPLTLSEAEYPTAGSRLSLLAPRAPIFPTQSTGRGETLPGQAGGACEVPAPPGSSRDSGVLLNQRGELVGLVLGPASPPKPGEGGRLVVLPVAEMRHSVERILRGTPGTKLELHPDSPTL